jgi:S-DNA-T family DNA segregation ATPase FtsK/SpoIIIE
MSSDPGDDQTDMNGRHLNRDLLSLGLLVVVLLLAMSLVTYDPADSVATVWPGLAAWYPVDPLVFPGHAEIQNACGVLGAMVAEALYSAFGFVAIYIVVCLALLCYWLLTGAYRQYVFGRGLGWLISLAGLTTLAALLVPTATPGPLPGSGGYVGLFLAGVLRQHFNLPGSLVISCGATLIGLLMWTDYALLNLALGLSRQWSVWRGVDPGAERSTGLSPWQAMMARFRAGRRVVGQVDIQDPDQCGTDAAGAHAWAGEPGYAPAVIIGGKRRSGLVVHHPEDEPTEEWEADADDPSGELPDAAEQPEETMLLVKMPRLAPVMDDTSPDPPPLDDQATDDPQASKEAARQTTVVKKEKKKSKDQQREEAISEIEQRIDLKDKADPLDDYELPALELLASGDGVNYEEQEVEVRRKARLLEQTFKEFGFNIKVTEIETGPVIAQYELALETGLRLSKIVSLADDLAIALRVPSVRIVAPIPGKNTVGVEVPNERRQIVRLRDVIEESSEKTKKMKIPIFLGKDVSGNPMAADLAALPHLLIAGRTGTGKSVCLNAIISSILMTRRPEEVRMLMIDPKMVELSGYSRLPHLMHPVVTDMKKAEAILAWAVDKMEERYSLLAQVGVRHLVNFNQLGAEEIYRRLGAETKEEQEGIPTNLPFIVIIADEMADLMMTAGKTVEQYIIRLAQKSRAVGIHLILATQKPTVDVITGLIKSNLPARIAFQVASKTDSRVVLDENGADKLLGNGDMLFLGPGTSILSRGQGTYLSDDEIESIVDSCAMAGKQDFITELVNLKVKDDSSDDGGGSGDNHGDDLYESAVEAVIREQRGSVSMLQRIFKIGYGRAARLIDFMAEDGVVGPYNGKIREVVMTIDQWRKKSGQAAEGPDDSPPPARATMTNHAHVDSPPARRSAEIVYHDDEEDDDESGIVKLPADDHAGAGGGSAAPPPQPSLPTVSSAATEADGERALPLPKKSSRQPAPPTVDKPRAQSASVTHWLEEPSDDVQWEDVD